jgi:dUTP pyrophosphatase
MKPFLSQRVKPSHNFKNFKGGILMVSACYILWYSATYSLSTLKQGIYMNRHKIETKIMNPLMGVEIPLPAYATDGAAAMDLRACMSDPQTVQPGQTVFIPSGIAISIHDPGLVALIVPRSGLGIKHGIVLANTVGVIDSDYQGEIGIGIHNRGLIPYTIEAGERICQIMFVPVARVTLEMVNEFSQESKRGAGGFGHTGRT